MRFVKVRNVVGCRRGVVIEVTEREREEGISTRAVRNIVVVGNISNLWLQLRSAVRNDP